MATWLQVKGDVVNFFAQSQGAPLMRFSMPRTTTSLGSTTTLKDTGLDLGTVSATEYNRHLVEIVETVASGPADGEIAAVTDGGYDGTDTLTLSPALTAAIQSGTDYILFPPDLTPAVLLQAANKVLRGTEGPHLYWPSLVTDADFDANDTTNWDAVSVPATREFVTTASRVLFGDRALHIISDSVGDGATSESVPVTENETLLLSVNLAVLSGTVTVQLYNVTASAAIEEVTVNEEAWQEVRFQDVVPADCENVSVRFIAATASSEWYVSGPVVLQSTYERTYVMPSWFERETQFMESLEQPQGYGSAGVNFSSVSYSRAWQAGPEIKFLRSVRGANPFMAQFAARNRPVALEAMRPFAEFSANTSTTNCNREYLMWMILASVARARRVDDWREYKRTGLGIGRKFRYGVEQSTLRENAQVAV